MSNPDPLRQYTSYAFLQVLEKQSPSKSFLGTSFSVVAAGGVSAGPVSSWNIGVRPPVNSSEQPALARSSAYLLQMILP
jgi:hypothetical protein